jgi:two-component system, NarL family, nitrate/nitrite response regulator NarL
MRPRILIADDHEFIRSSLRRFLEANTDFEVCGEALNGLEAIAYFQELRPDLIILDLSMPIMDGLEAAVEIRKIAAEIPIILYTLHDSPQLKIEATRVGVQAVIAKAAGIQALLTAIKALIKNWAA